MAVGIIRVRPINSMQSVGNSDIHNLRIYEENGYKTPSNINPEGSFFHENHRTGEMFETHEEMSKSDITSTVESINDRFKEAGIKPRKGAVVAIEYVISFRGRDLEAAFDKNTFLSKAVDEFLTERHGKENIISSSFHHDESSPHVHVIVTPIINKEVKYKNRYKEGKKIEDRLCSRDFIGGRDKLRTLQNDYHQYLSETYDGKPYIDSRTKEEKTLKFTRGTLVEHQLKEYVRKTDHEIGKLRNDLNSGVMDLATADDITTNMHVEMMAQFQKKIEEGKIRLDEVPEELKRLLQESNNQRADLNLKNRVSGWKKGIDFETGSPDEGISI